MKSRNIALLILAFMILAAGCDSAMKADRDYAFTWGETRIEMHDRAAPLVEALGGPQRYSEKANAAFDGPGKTYDYGSFCFSTYPAENKDLIYSLWFSDENVCTEEGIALGATQAQVEQVYGSGCFQDTNACTLTGKTSRLIIILSEGVVSAISYEAILS